MSNKLKRMQKRAGRVRADREEAERNEAPGNGTMGYKYEFRERQSWTFLEKRSEEHEAPPRGIPGVYELLDGGIRPVAGRRGFECGVVVLM